MFTQSCQYSKNHEIAHFKRVDFIVCKLHFHFEKSNTRTYRNWCAHILLARVSTIKSLFFFPSQDREATYSEFLQFYVASTSILDVHWTFSYQKWSLITLDTVSTLDTAFSQFLKVVNPDICLLQLPPGDHPPMGQPESLPMCLVPLTPIPCMDCPDTPQ